MTGMGGVFTEWDLDKLVPGSVVVDDDGDAWQRDVSGDWQCCRSVRPWAPSASSEELTEYAPFLVVWVPEPGCHPIVEWEVVDG